MHDLVKALAAICTEAREKAGKDHMDVAVSFVGERPGPVTLQRFEWSAIDHKDATHWPRDPEATVNAYGKATGVPAARLWHRAIDRWAEGQAQDAARAKGHSKTRVPLTAPQPVQAKGAKDPPAAGSESGTG